MFKNVLIVEITITTAPTINSIPSTPSFYFNNRAVALTVDTWVIDSFVICFQRKLFKKVDSLLNSTFARLSNNQLLVISPSANNEVSSFIFNATNFSTEKLVISGLADFASDFKQVTGLLPLDHSNLFITSSFLVINLSSKTCYKLTSGSRMYCNGKIQFVNVYSKSIHPNYLAIYNSNNYGTYNNSCSCDTTGTFIPFRLLYGNCSFAELLQQQLVSKNGLQDISFPTNSGTVISAHSLVIKCRCPLLLQASGITVKYSEQVVKGIIDYCYSNYISGLTDETSEEMLQEYMQMAQELKLESVKSVCQMYKEKKLKKVEEGKELQQVKELIAGKKYNEALSMLTSNFQNFSNKKNSSMQLENLHLQAQCYTLQSQLEKALSVQLQALDLEPANLLLLNAITFTVHSILKSKSKITKQLAQHIEKAGKAGIAKSFECLINDSSSADFKFKLLNQVYPVHKLFITLESEFFKELLSEEFNNELELNLDSQWIPLFEAASIAQKDYSKVAVNVMKLLQTYFYSHSVFSLLNALPVQELKLVTSIANLVHLEQLKFDCETEFIENRLKSGNEKEMIKFAFLQDLSRLKLEAQLISGACKTPLSKFSLHNEASIQSYASSVLEPSSEELLLLHDAVLREKVIQISELERYSKGMALLMKPIQLIHGFKVKFNVQTFQTRKTVLKAAEDYHGNFLQLIVVDATNLQAIPWIA